MSAQIKKEPFPSFDEMLQSIEGKQEEIKKNDTQETPESIIKEFAPIVAADRLRRAKNGINI